MADDSRPVRRIDDPDVLKGLAQPIRQKLWRLLLQRGPCTVGTLAGQLGTDPGQTSYHLRELARRGWVEHAPDLARDRRESWWRAVHQPTAWRVEDFDTPEGRSVVEHLDRQIVRENLQRLQDARQGYPQQSERWRAAFAAEQSFLHLTADEAQAMNAELHQVLVQWAHHGHRALDGGDVGGRRPYFHFMYGFPEAPGSEEDR